MALANNPLFTSDLWERALERYASDTHLSVKLFDADERVVFGPVHPTPLFQLFEERGYDPGIFAECAHRCLAQTNNRPAVMVSEFCGLTVVGTSLVLEGKIVGAAVGGYAFVDFSQLSEVQRLAKDAGIQFERLWEVAREQKPVPKHRLMLNGELLQVLGDALLRENYRTRQYEDAVRKLEETARAKEATHQELRQTASALRESQERLMKELAATRQLQSASALLLEGGDEHALYQKIVDAAAAIMGSDMASMQMLHPERGAGGELRLLAFRGFDPEAAKFWEWVRADSACSCGQALRSRSRVVVQNLEKCDFVAGTEDQTTYFRAGIRAVQSTPLLSRAGELLGMISTHWRTPHTPEESDLLRFDVLARQAADLLERSQAEAAARSLAAIVESSDDAIISKDLNGVITSWNRGAERLFGYTAQEAVGRPVTMLMPPERVDEEPGILERIRHGESIEHYETVRRRKDGKLLDISLTVSPLRNSQGRITGASKIARDITERKQAEEALRRAAEFDEAVMANMGEGLYTVDSEGLVTSINPAAEKLFGWSFAEMRGRKMHDLSHHHHPDGRPFPAEECSGLQVIRQGKTLINHEDVFIRKDGSFFNVILSSAPLRSGDGGIIGLVVVFRDITERKQAEEALQESESRFRMLADNMSQLAWTCDRLGNVTWYNQRWLDYTGLTFEDMKGWNWSKVQHPDHLERVVARVKRSAETGEPWDDTFPLLDKDGNYRWFLSRAVPIRDADGKIIRWFGTNTDVTEQRQAEEALRDAAQRFRFMAESMPHKIFTATPAGDIDYFNPQWMEFTGLSFQQIKNWGWTQFVHPDDVEENVRRWRHSIATGETFYFEHRIRRADGSYHWHFSRALPLRDAGGTIVMWIGSNADIQPIKDQEERLRKSEKMAAAGKLAASLAHEINNPLSSVTNALYLLENDRNLDESARLFVNTAATELARVSRIVKQSLSYYRVGSRPRELDLGEIVHESLQIFGDKFTRAGIELKLRVHNGTQVIGFADELRQVIDNLLLNAMEAMPYGGRLNILLHDSSDWKHHHDCRKGIRLTIADTGCGIPREQRWRIFEPFFTTKPEKGTGLGLWVLQGIVSKHEGSLSLRSSDVEGRSGTVVSIFLPSHNAAPVESEVARSESAA